MCQALGEITCNFFFLNHILGPVPKQIKTEWDWVSWGNDRTSPAETALPLGLQRGEALEQAKVGKEEEENFLFN